MLCHQRRPQLQSVYGNTYEVRKPLAIGFKKRNTVEVPLQWRAFHGNSSGRVLFQAFPDLAAGAVATAELTALGATVQLTAEVRDQNASVMAGVTITWTSSAVGVATVDAAGLVTAAGNGTATITASAGSASGSAVVTVVQSVANPS